MLFVEPVGASGGGHEQHASEFAPFAELLPRVWHDVVPTVVDVQTRAAINAQVQRGFFLHEQQVRPKEGPAKSSVELWRVMMTRAGRPVLPLPPFLPVEE